MERHTNLYNWVELRNPRSTEGRTLTFLRRGHTVSQAIASPLYLIPTQQNDVSRVAPLKVTWVVKCISVISVPRCRYIGLGLYGFVLQGNMVIVGHIFSTICTEP